MQACGLKLIIFWRKSISSVTPHAGVWIETLWLWKYHRRVWVTPHAGVWIETCCTSCVLCLHNLSRLMQACGLKLQKTHLPPHVPKCHASCRRVDWNRFIYRFNGAPRSHASCRRVDWNSNSCRLPGLNCMSRLMQACGLKLIYITHYILLLLSRLMQACGLKLYVQLLSCLYMTVTPHAGVWIETAHLS